MKYKTILCFFFIGLCAFGCKRSDQKIKELLEGFIDTQVTIPEDLLIFNNGNNPIKRDAKYKVISYVDSLDCTLCYLNQYHVAWTNLLAKFKDADFSLLIIFHSQDIDGIRDLFEIYKSDVPFLLDFYGDFKTKLPPEKILHTFLLEDSTVVLAGNPFNNSKLLPLYEQKISGN